MHAHTSTCTWTCSMHAHTSMHMHLDVFNACTYVHMHLDVFYACTYVHMHLDVVFYACTYVHMHLEVGVSLHERCGDLLVDGGEGLGAAAEDTIKTGLQATVEGGMRLITVYIYM